ncbi:hypothetical protein M407DRAFT_241423 [Tulasnella calospora MUT 4182]|uniref:Uncharacterized protein n=1 Tax=Tulasnella calospora MUT 4182 TaxID=1051891 RepID=A0A0C3QVA7_9AGAM|nr:hypothetical protein M407DRAFT_241423 [Tulasnella calospora MUT 4182]
MEADPSAFRHAISGLTEGLRIVANRFARLNAVASLGLGLRKSKSVRWLPPG